MCIHLSERLISEHMTQARPHVLMTHHTSDLSHWLITLVAHHTGDSSHRRLITGGSSYFNSHVT